MKICRVVKTFNVCVGSSGEDVSEGILARFPYSRYCHPIRRQFYLDDQFNRRVAENAEVTLRRQVGMYSHKISGIREFRGKNFLSAEIRTFETTSVGKSKVDKKSYVHNF